MATTQFPTTEAAETGAGLTSPTNLNAADGSFATALPGKNITLASKAQNFGFDSVIPAGAVIDNVKIEVKYLVSTQSSIATGRIYYKIGGVAGANHDDATEPLSSTVFTYDVTSARAWTRADLLDGTFEIACAAVQGNSSTAVTFSFDYVNAQVTWHLVGSQTITGVANIFVPPPVITWNNYESIKAGDGISVTEHIR